MCPQQILTPYLSAQPEEPLLGTILDYPRLTLSRPLLYTADLFEAAIKESCGEGLLVSLPILPEGKDHFLSLRTPVPCTEEVPNTLLTDQLNTSLAVLEL